MDTATQAALRRINREFYRRHAADFDRTRHAGGWPGWRRVVEAARTAARATARPRGRLSPEPEATLGSLRRSPDDDRPLRVLDLGCGNGRFALFLEGNLELRRSRPFAYLGIDSSRELIDRARAAAADLPHVRFEVDDLEALRLEPGRHDLVVLFGVLHHLPGAAARRLALERAAAAVAPGGLLAFTCWQFADDPGFERRRLHWASQPGVAPHEVEPGDHLLRWGPNDSKARRYCHHIDEPELDRLTDGLPLAEAARYRADGPGGRQNLYWLGAR